MMTRAIRSRIVFMSIIALLIVIVLGLGGFTINNLASRVASANDRNATQANQISDLLDDLHASQENAQQLYDQLLALGESPQGDPPSEVVPVVPENGRDGQDGARGPVGPSPSAIEILSAVGQCFSSGTCTAPKGDKGDPGVGSTGPAGPAGPAGQDSTVPGPQGPAGADGRGIQSLYCGDTTGRWVITYTDNVTADAGACRTTLIEGELP